MSKGNNRGYNLLVAAGCLLFVLLNQPEKITRDELEEIRVIAKAGVQEIKTRRSSNEYRITSTDNNSFVITTAGGSASKWTIENNIHANDTLYLQIKSFHFEKDTITNAQVFALSSPSRVFYTVEDYNHAKKLLERRWNIFFMVIGVICMLRGLGLISGKASLIIGGIALAAAIVLRILNIGY
jgi:hypothetical protein